MLFRKPGIKENNVVHYKEFYLGLSETFIYNILKNLQDFKPVFIAKSAANLDKFPIDTLYTTSSISRFSWWWLINGLQYRLGNKKQFVEHAAYICHIIKQHKAHLIHAHFGPAGVMMLPIKRSLSLPMVTTFYGFDMSSLPKQTEWKRKYARLFSEGDLFLAEGSQMREKLIHLGCPEIKIKIQRIGVNLEQLTFQERTIHPDQKVILLFCGRFVEKKGLIYALHAVKRVLKQFPNLEFRIIGDGEGRSEIERFIADSNIKPYIKLFGYQPYDVCLEQLSRAHILIQPSVTASDGDTEGGAPTVLLEAQACGLPVLSTRHADIPETVRDGESGYLVPERDTEALAERLAYLLEHPSEWPIMGRIGRKHIEKNHNIKIQARLLEDLYQELVKS